MEKKLQRNESGQILILLSVGLVILLGFVALSLDGGATFLDRRSAQSAADAAALAGAYELANDPWNTTTLTTRITNAASARAHDNHYGTLDGKTVTVYYPPDAATINFVAGDTNVNNYVRVTITSTVSTSFLQFIYSSPIRNTVQAVAHTVPPVRGNPFAGSGIVALDPTGCGAFYTSGSAKAYLLEGGIFVNSDSPNCAADGGGSSNIFTPSMTIVGGISGTLAGNISSSNPIDQNDASAKMAYPPDIGIQPVPTCSTNSVKGASITVKGVTYNRYSPGKMNGFPNGNVYFDPGIFCITINGGGGTSNINNNQHFYNDPNDPTRVLLVVTGSDPCNVSINGGATLQLKGYNVDPWKGLLFYFDPRDFSKAAPTGEGPLALNGTQDSYINGTVYAPTCNIKMNGTGGNFYQGQVIGYDITLLGGAQIDMLFIDADNWKEQGPAKIDLNQ
jgi:Flp pilus assembly protein TadG